MKKKLLATLLISTTIAGAGVQVFAADQTATSPASVSFVENDGTTDPVDPENPDPTDPITPVDPTDPTKPLPPTGNKGPLSLDFASAFYFGEQKITSAAGDYKAAAQLVQEKDETFTETTNYVQVTDNRGDVAKGWTLSVKQNGQFVTESKKELTGSELKFADANGNSIGDLALSPTVTKDFSLVPDAEQEIAKAENGNGSGTWVIRFGQDSTLADKNTVTGKYNDETKKVNSEVTLGVPAGTQRLKETYKTSLTWTLKDVPGDNTGEPEEPEA